MKINYRPYQTEAIKRGIKHFQAGNNLLLECDEGGLGKSLMSLKIAEALKPKLVLLLGPAFLVKKWDQEIDKWLPKKNRPTILNYSYSNLLDYNFYKYIMKHTYDFAIFDEFHYLKNFESKRTRIILGHPGDGRRVVSRVKKLLPISGTPIPNRVGEIYPILWSKKNPVIQNMTYENFVIKWAKEYRETRRGLSHSGVKNAASLRALLKPHMIRRKISDVAKDLPEKNYIDIPLEMSEEMYRAEKTQYLSYLELSGADPLQVEMAADDPEFFVQLVHSLPGFTEYSEFRKKQGFIKIPVVFEHIKNMIAEGHTKLLIFTYHRDIAEQYRKLLYENFPSLPVTYITGDTPANDRIDMVAYADNQKEHILLSTMGAIKEGVDAPGFKHVLYAEIDWRQYLHVQTEWRVRRVTSTSDPIFFYYFIFNKGMDKKVFENMSNNKSTVNEILDGVVQ